MTQRARHLPALGRLPAQRQRRREFGRLGGPVAVERQRVAFAAHFGIGPCDCTVQADRAEFRCQACLDPARFDRGKVLSLAQVAGDGDVGNRVLHLVIEGGDRKHDRIDRLPVQADLEALEPFVLEIGIGFSGDGEHHERPVEFVQGRQTQPGIGRRAQVEPPCGMDHCARAPAQGPIVAVRGDDLAHQPARR